MMWIEQCETALVFAEENQKKYAELDARFKESPLLKKLLEKSKENKEKYILNKLCISSVELVY